MLMLAFTVAMSAAFANVLQGDGRAAVATLRAIDPSQVDEKYRPVRACMLERLDKRVLPKSSVGDDKLIDGLLRTYQEYWLRSLRAEHPAEDNQRWLLDSLNAVAGTKAPDLDALEPELQARVVEHGWHSLHGLTLPLRELMLWKRETAKQYDVQLPEGRTQPVTVTFMDGFASLGWAAFATCDAAHSGGWTKPDGLYAVASAYDVNSESFRVSYLAHEAQHFYDGTHFPGIEQPELEYRAKLTELAIAKDTAHELLESFAANVSADRAVPHSWANAQVVERMRAGLFGNASATWRQAHVPAINRVALQLLKDDTKQRLSAR